MKKEEVTADFIRLDAGRENTILSILLAADGTVNRMGNGRAGDIAAESTLYIGAGEQRLFHDFISRMPDALLERPGRYDMPEPQGIPCRLTLLFAGRGDTGARFEVNYGSESEKEREEQQHPWSDTTC